MPLSAQVEEPLCFFSSCVSIKGGRNWTLEVACSIVSDMCCCDSPHKAEPPCHPSRPSQTSPQHYMGVLDPFLLTANMCSSTVAVLTKDKHLLREKDRKNRQNRNCQRGIGVRKAVDLAMKRNQTTEMSSSRRFCCRRFGVRTNEKRERERERERAVWGFYRLWELAGIFEMGSGNATLFPSRSSRVQSCSHDIDLRKRIGKMCRPSGH